MITTEQIKELRDQTGVSVMQCKKALEEAGGNMETALMILKKKSTEIAAKKSDREATNGVVAVEKSGSKAVMLTLRCETDFVAKNSDFTDLAALLAKKALAGGAIDAENDINPVIQKVGENIKLGDIITVEGATIGSYVHGGRSGVVVALTGGTEDLAKDIAMHIAAMHPEYRTKTDIPADTRAAVTELCSKEVADLDKPAEIKQKILDGKIDTYFKERTLVDQAFIKNPDLTVGALLAKAGATLESYSVASVA